MIVLRIYYFCEDPKIIIETETIKTKMKNSRICKKKLSPTVGPYIPHLGSRWYSK